MGFERVKQKTRQWINLTLPAVWVLARWVHGIVGSLALSVEQTQAWRNADVGKAPYWLLVYGGQRSAGLGTWDMLLPLTLWPSGNENCIRSLQMVVGYRYNSLLGYSVYLFIYGSFVAGFSSRSVVIR
jgi:hypothetical protein